MALLFLPFFLLLVFLLPLAHPLSPDYYDKTCPQLHTIIRQTVTDKQLISPSTAAATVRIFFHDCMVDGCDASILISSNPFNPSPEREADINLSLPGDGFDVVVRAKTALEIQCPGVVSCADILSLATRDLITMTGGPFYPVLLGRRDGTVSSSFHVNGHLARPEMPMSEIISLFSAKNLTVKDMVALTGAHTIGFSHCKEFSGRIYGFSETSEYDPRYNPAYATGLRRLCENYTTDTAMAAFNDVMTPGKFDNMYYVNLKRGLGLLSSDQGMAEDERTKGYVELFAGNQTAFFEAFVEAMGKVGVYKVKTGSEGEIRRRCDAFNTITTL